MIEKPEADRPRGVHQRRGRAAVCQARLGIAGRMIVRHGERTTIVPQHGVEHFTDWYRGSVDGTFGNQHPLLDPVPGIAYEYDYAFTPLIREHPVARRYYIGSFAKLCGVIDRLGGTLSHPERRNESRRLGHANARMASEFLGPHSSHSVQPAVCSKQAASHFQRAFPWPSMT